MGHWAWPISFVFIGLFNLALGLNATGKPKAQAYRCARQKADGAIVLQLASGCFRNNSACNKRGESGCKLLNSGIDAHKATSKLGLSAAGNEGHAGRHSA